MILLLILLHHPLHTLAGLCDSASMSVDVPADVVAAFCAEKEQWMTVADKASAEPQLTEMQRNWVQEKLECTFEECVYYDGSSCTQSELSNRRVELRSVTQVKRHALEIRFRELQNDQVDGVSKLQLIHLLSAPWLSPGAHFAGVMSLAHWMELLRIMDLALMEPPGCNPLPFWSPLPEFHLVNPADSMIWFNFERIYNDTATDASNPRPISPFFPTEQQLDMLGRAMTKCDIEYVELILFAIMSLKLHLNPHDCTRAVARCKPVAILAVIVATSAARLTNSL